eukprot:2957193-Pyramimonas_sp.AAC.1
MLWGGGGARRPGRILLSVAMPPSREARRGPRGHGARVGLRGAVPPCRQALGQAQLRSGRPPG